MLKQFEEWAEETDTAPVEAISSAALEYEGQLFTARSHAEAWSLLVEAKPDFDENLIHDGFITNTGRFISREEALIVAKNSKQISPESRKQGKNTLDSYEVTSFER